MDEWQVFIYINNFNNFITLSYKPLFYLKSTKSLCKSYFILAHIPCTYLHHMSVSTHLACLTYASGTQKHSYQGPAYCLQTPNPFSNAQTGFQIYAWPHSGAPQWAMSQQTRCCPQVLVTWPLCPSSPLAPSPLQWCSAWLPHHPVLSPALAPTLACMLAMPFIYPHSLGPCRPCYWRTKF